MTAIAAEYVGINNVIGKAGHCGTPWPRNVNVDPCMACRILIDREVNPAAVTLGPSPLHLRITLIDRKSSMYNMGSQATRRLSFNQIATPVISAIVAGRHDNGL